MTQGGGELEAGAAPERGDLLFLYGTLRRGGAPARALGLHRALTPLGHAQMVGALYDLGAYPGMVRAGPGRVQGELYRVTDPRLFAELDRYEGFDPDAPAASLFVRIRAPLHGRRGAAWVYVYNRAVSGRAVIASGRWRGA